MEKILITRAGHTALSDELKTLKSVERPAVIQAIAEAREHGDLSENAEYHAAREKQSHDWPLAEAAVSLRLQGGRMSEVRIALGHVAPTPWRASEAEALLEGQAPSEALFAKAAAAALSKARPLPGSAYKVPVTQGVVRYALHAATGLALPE